MRVLVLEPHAIGHHASYLRWLVQATERKAWNVVLATTTEALSHPALRTISAEFDHVDIHHIKDAPPPSTGHPLRLFRREVAYRDIFRGALSEVHSKTPVDAIILPYVDYCFYALAILGTPFYGIPWSGISMRLARPRSAGPADPRMNWKWRMARRILGQPSLRALFVINPSIQDLPSSWHLRGTPMKLRYLPDPAEFNVPGSREEARTSFKISSSNIAVLVFGAIDERKGIDALVTAITVEADLANYVVILAGQQCPVMQSKMRTALYSQLHLQNRLIVLDRFVSFAEQNALLAAADVMWVGYLNHIYMSGVMVLAGRAGLPLVGTKDGEIGRLITEHGIGVVAVIEQPGDVAQALRNLCDARRRITMGQRAQMAFAEHTPENFGTSVLSAFDA